jgi:hypothetical protein
LPKGERNECFNAAHEAFAADIEMCACYEEQEAALAARFEFCNAETDPVKKEQCLASLYELLDQMKEDNCHEQPEPDCYEDAQAELEENLAECETLDDMSGDK